MVDNGMVRLPGGFITDPARSRAVPVAPAASLTDPAVLGAMLVASGMDPIVAGQTIGNVQQVISRAVLEAVYQVVAAVNQAQAARSAVLSAAIRAMPAVDVAGARAAMAVAVADPSLSVIPDPTP